MKQKIRTMGLIISTGCIVAAHGAVHPYTALRGGLSIVNTVDVDVSDYGTPPMTGRGELDLSTGGNIEGAFGVGISGGIPIRLELAGGYQRNNITALEDVRVDGKIEVGSIIANLYFDIVDFEAAYDPGPYDSPVIPYFFLGGGVAFAAGELEGDSSSDEIGIFNIGVGVGLNLTERLWADLQYKYLVAEDMEISDSTGKAEIQMEASQIQFGIRYMF